MKKLVEKLLNWCKKSMKMRICVGKSANPERVLPSMAMETVGETVLPAAVEAVGMAETIGEKAAFGKSGRKKPENMLEALQCFLTARYNFRYNLLTEQTEYRGKEMPDEEYAMVAQRDLNTFCLEAHSGGINCWDKDVSRLLHSRKVENYHPFLHYMSHLPQWDGVDRVTPLAVRISRKPMWVKGFHRWMLGVAAQWLGQAQDCANAVAPMLVSREQGKRKSSFCKILMPKELTPYYIDKFDLTSESGCEQKLSLFGLINMDEFDKYRAGQMPALKNLMQMTTLTFRRAHRSAFSHLPRIASFIGTSNMTDLLTDPTGSRRFLCAEVDDKIDCTPPDHAQLFAQLKAELVGGERYWFSEEEEKEIQHSNRNFYKMPAEQELFLRCFRMPQEGELSKPYTTTDLFNYLQKHYPAAMRGVTPNRLGRMMVALGIQRVHTEYGNVYRLEQDIEELKDRQSSEHSLREVNDPGIQVIDTYYYQVEGVRMKERLLIFAADYQHLDQTGKLFYLHKDKYKANCCILKKYDSILHAKVPRNKIYTLKKGLRSIYINNYEYHLMCYENCPPPPPEPEPEDFGAKYKSVAEALDRVEKDWSGLLDAETEYYEKHLFLSERQRASMRRMLRHQKNTIDRYKNDLNEMADAYRKENQEYKVERSEDDLFSGTER